MLQTLAKNFLRGLLLVVPIGLTVYIVRLIVVTVDDWIALERLVGREIPGGGLVLTLVAITMIGFLARFFAVRWLFQAMDEVFGRLPLVKLIYTSIRDLIDAFVGEKKRFDRPVLVSLDDGGEISVVGFQTRDSLAEFGLADHAAVYLPQSYNFAGNLIVVPRARVRAVSGDSTTVMAFIVSGGVSGLPEPAPQGAQR